MTILKKITFSCPKLFPGAEKSSRGAVTVEYALTMVVAAILMIGVELMFRRLATEVITRFKDIVSIFPNI